VRVGIFDNNNIPVGSIDESLAGQGDKLRIYHGDVRQATQLKTAVDDFASAGLDIMINNAGVAAGGGFLEMPVEDWDWILSINLMGVVNGCKAALPHLLKTGGTLHNVASGAGFMSSPLMASYNASKAGVVALTETLIGEYQQHKNLHISVSMPAFFKSNLLSSLRASEDEAYTASLLTQYSGYTVEQAKNDIVEGLLAKQIYIFAPKKLKTFWRWKRFFPLHYLSTFPGLRAKKIQKLRSLVGENID
jgi:NAD(P)-dependent dehydrogenase (short-subunit alcohol dehydrogenase family)